MSENTISPRIVQNPNPAVPLAALVQFDASDFDSATVSINDGRQTRTLHFDDRFDPSQGLPILGLYEGQQHEVTIEISAKNGRDFGTFDFSYTAPNLPHDSLEYPVIEIVECVPDRLEPGYTFLALWRRIPTRAMWMTQKQHDFFRNWGMIVCIDPDGRIVWSYKADKQLQGIIRLPNGNIFYHTEHFQSVEIDMLGNEVRKFHATSTLGNDLPDSIGIDASSIHHMPFHMENGNFLCLTAQVREFENYYANETNPDDRETKKVVGDKIVEFTPEGEVVWEWDAFDHLDPFRIGYNFTNLYWHVRGFHHHYDWTHGNGVCHDPSDNSIVVSFRHQCAVLKISRETKEILWILGTHENWGPECQSKLLNPVGDDFQWHWHGHNPRVTGPNRFVMYDNRNLQAMPFNERKKPAECFARAVEYEVDGEQMTVRQRWTSRDTDETRVVSWAMGDAHRLPQTGNFLVIDSDCNPTDDPITASGDVRQADLIWDNFDRTKFNEADFPSWVRIREMKANDTADVLWEAQIKHPHDAIGWNVFGGFRSASMYPEGIEVSRTSNYAPRWVSARKVPTRAFTALFFLLW